MSLSSLREEPFVLLARSTFSTLYQHALICLCYRRVLPRVTQEVQEPFAVLNLVRAGLGVSLVPSAVRRMQVPGIRFFPTEIGFCVVENPHGVEERQTIAREPFCQSRSVCGGS